MKIGIRKGHLGAVKGSKGTSGYGYKEVDLNVDVGDRVAKRLEEHNFEVYQKAGDLGDTLYNYYNKYLTDKDLLLPIHHNGYDSSSTGSEVLISIYAKDKAKKHANMLLNYFVETFGTKSRGIVQRKSAKTGRDYYGIIKNTKPKVILGEPLFMTNKNDMAIVKKNYDKFIINQAECYLKVACSWYGVKYKSPIPTNTTTTTTITTITNNNNEIKTLKEQNKQIISTVDNLLARIKTIETKNHQLADLIIEIQEKIKHIESPENYNEVLKLIQWLKNYKN